jgi:hypothetical protein
MSLAGTSADGRLRDCPWHDSAPKGAFIILLVRTCGYQRPSAPAVKRNELEVRKGGSERR